MLYSHNGNYPEKLPFRIKLPDGTSRTNPDEFTDEEIALAGYVAVDDAPIAGQFESVYWDASGWLVVEHSESQKMQAVESHKQNIAAHRYEVESSSIPWNDVDETTWFIDNTFDSQQRLTSAKTAIDGGIRADGGSWKLAKLTDNGVVVTFRPTTNAEITEWAALSVSQVQLAFEVEAICNQKINDFVAAGDYPSALSVDFFVEWSTVNAEIA